MRTTLFRRTSLGSALVLALAACARAAAPTSHVRPERSRPAVDFENRGTEVVTVYLAEGSSTWRLGRVEPGRRAALRLPADVAIGGGFEVALVVVPLAAANPLGGARAAAPGAVRSPTGWSEEYVTARWILAGSELVSVPTVPSAR